MKANKQRVERLENKIDTSDRIPLEIVLVSSKEEADHPERFRKVLDSEEVAESGIKIRHFHYERL